MKSLFWMARGIVLGGIALGGMGCGGAPCSPGAEGACPADNPFCHAFGDACWTDEQTEVAYAAAADLCSTLGGELPGISELRGLFVSCAATEPGGACGVTDQCASSSCMNDACVGCGDGGLNEFGNENIFWSRTANADVAGEHFVAVYRYGMVTSMDETKAFSAYCRVDQ